MSVDIAFIGTGGRSGSHLDTLEDVDDAEVVAVCDIDEAAAESAADPHDAEVFTDHHDLYAEADFDAVFVGLPPFAHEDQETMAAERGIDLFVEKPIALSVEKACEIRDVVAENGVVAQVGYQRRYADAVEHARELLADRPVGLVEGYWQGGVPGGPDHWWRVKERSGGQVVEQATHIYDMVRYFAGDVTEVAAYGDRRIVDAIDFEDCVATAMRHETGAVSQVSSSSASSDHKVGWEVLAEDARLRFRGNSYEGVVDGAEVSYDGSTNPSRRQVLSFVEAVRAGDPGRVKAPYDDAVKTLAATLAVNEALETGEAVAPDA